MIDLPSVHSIIVCFNPDYRILGQELNSLRKQVEKIWIIDNSSREVQKDFSNWLQNNPIWMSIKYLPQSHNIGLGAAQNIGIQNAIENGAKYVLIMDQDSLPEEKMVAELTAAFEKLEKKNLSVAATSPLVFDNSMKSNGFLRYTWCTYRNLILNDANSSELYKIDLTISSGTLISRNSWQNIGPMDEGLFIDLVDTEWCLRAAQKGFQLYGITSAKMVHFLGEHKTKVWFLRWRHVSHHKPFRYYYMVRNSLLLLARKDLPWKWKSAELLKILRNIIFFSLFSKHRVKKIRMMSKGIYDGLHGVTGQMQ